MPFNDKQIAVLSAPLGKSHVKERSQAGRSLSYIEAWHAISEANRIFGFDAWNRETVELRELGPAREIDGKWRVGYMAKVRVTVGEIVREGCGFGSGIDRDLHQAHESALKEAESDAMKRAFMTFGNPFGLALYDKTQANVEDDRRPPTRAGRQSDAPVSAAHLAIQQLRSYAADRATFLEFWTKNYQGWKGVMSDEEYASVVAEMKAINARFPTQPKPQAD